MSCMYIHLLLQHVAEIKNSHFDLILHLIDQIVDNILISMLVFNYSIANYPSLKGKTYMHVQFQTVVSTM